MQKPKHYIVRLFDLIYNQRIKYLDEQASVACFFVLVCLIK